MSRKRAKIREPEKSKESHEKPGDKDKIEMGRGNRSQILTLVFSIIVVAVIVSTAHWPALSAKALLFDDDQYLSENSLVKNPRWDSASRFLSEVFEPSTVEGYYQPLAMISLMLDYARGERTDNLYIFHQTSLLLHLLNTALVIVLIFGLFGRIWVAATAGLLFGLHPMMVETITWVGERKTVLAAFFALLSLNCYVGYVRNGGWKFYALTMLLYVLALMSKPTSTPLPILMLVLDYWPLRRLGKAAIMEKIPMLLIGGVSGVITIISQARTASVQVPANNSMTVIPLIMCCTVIFYISKIFNPVHLCAHYPFPSSFNLSEPMVLAGMIGAMILMVAVAISIRWTRVFLAGLLFFFIGILPTMQLIKFANVIAADRFVYLPIVGLLISGAYVLIRLWQSAAANRFVWLCRVGIVAIVLFAAAREAVVTRQYFVHWQDTKTLFSYMIEMAPNAPSLHIHLGVFYYKNGSTDKAVYEWSKAVELRPDYADALNNLAWVLATDEDAQKRDGSKAVTLAQRACELTGYKNSAMLDTLAAAYAEVGKFEDAVSTIQRGMQIAVKAERRDLADKMDERRKLYLQGRAFHGR